MNNLPSSSDGHPSQKSPQLCRRSFFPKISPAPLPTAILPENLPSSSSDGHPKNLPSSSSDDYPENLPSSSSDDHPENLPSSSSDGHPEENLPSSSSDGHPENLPSSSSDGHPSRGPTPSPPPTPSPGSLGLLPTPLPGSGSPSLAGSSLVGSAASRESMCMLLSPGGRGGRELVVGGSSVCTRSMSGGEGGPFAQLVICVLVLRFAMVQRTNAI